MLNAAPPPSDYATLANDIIDLYASIHAASYRLLKLIQTFDAADYAQKNGFVSTAAWLGFYLGIGPNAAREKVRVARALPDLELIERAYARGQISFSKVRAITRVAHGGNQARLLNYARCATAHQVERFVRDQARLQRGRQPVSTRAELTWMEAENGDVLLRGRLPKELGLLLLSALEQMTDKEVFDPDRADAEPLATRRALALVEIAEQSLAPQSDQSQSSADRYTVHIDHDDPGLSDAASKRLTCDASTVVYQADEDAHPLNVGRKTRTIPPAIRRALRRRDKGCRYPGCTHTRFVDAHHVQHWADGGATKLDNLLLLCRRHHTLVHEHRAEVRVYTPSRGAVQFHFYDVHGERILLTGEHRVASAQLSELEGMVVGRVTAVTSADRSPFAPIEPASCPDYREIAAFLSACDPPLAQHRDPSLESG